MIAWHGSLLYHGGKAGEKESPSAYWKPLPSGTYAPFIQNTFPKHIWEACRRFIHLADNRKNRPKKGSPNYDPIFKCRKLMEKIMDRMVKNWIAGEKVCIDESMILYTGRAITFCQYMPAKPITHGIKVFLLTCKNHVIGWEIYLGKDFQQDNSAEAVVVRLITNTNLTLHSGRILYTDNWYTSIKLATTLFKDYDWLFVGTSAPTEKKRREADDIPFHRYSSKAIDSLEQGWSRHATTTIKGKYGKTGMVQVTTWKDRKQVMFVHTHMVGNTDGETTLRYVKGKKNRAEISCPPIAKDYSLNMNGVDKSDRDGRDNSVTIRSNRWYLRIRFWTIERAVHCAYVVVCYMANSEQRMDWKKYTNKHDGRKNFQIDLGIGLMEFGIRYDWGGDVNDETKKPTWMRQKPPRPCECNTCFFCKEGITDGIYHARGSKRVSKSKRHSGDALKNEKRKANSQCTGIRESFKTSSYCGACYQALSSTLPSRR